jgi:hypothetical protein
MVKHAPASQGCDDRGNFFSCDFLRHVSDHIPVPNRCRNWPKSRASTVPPLSKSKMGLLVPKALRNAPKSMASTVPPPLASP